MAIETQAPTERPTMERERLSAIEAVLPHLATKADVERMRVDLIKWQIGIAIAVVGAVFAIVRFLG